MRWLLLATVVDLSENDRQVFGLPGAAWLRRRAARFSGITRRWLLRRPMYEKGVRA